LEHWQTFRENLAPLSGGTNFAAASSDDS
jgi:hypothetical protein